MRIIVFADTHGFTRAVKDIFERNEDAPVFIFLGDGEQDLARMRRSYPEKTILSVAGNCDYSSESPENAVYNAGGVKLFFTHGHNWGVKYSADRLFYKAKEIDADIALFAHTHKRYYEYSEEVHILNPGSAAYPRDGKPPCYAFIDITSKGIFCAHVDL
ncbi:MAG: metallophosphoesterase [Ruminococcus sp.]|nr:metallophosphoesterase [Ruminococcus sp.]